MIPLEEYKEKSRKIIADLKKTKAEIDEMSREPETEFDYRGRGNQYSAEEKRIDKLREEFNKKTEEKKNLIIKILGSLFKEGVVVSNKLSVHDGEFRHFRHHSSWIELSSIIQYLKEGLIEVENKLDTEERNVVNFFLSLCDDEFLDSIDRNFKKELVIFESKDFPIVSNNVAEREKHELQDFEYSDNIKISMRVTRDDIRIYFGYVKGKGENQEENELPHLIYMERYIKSQLKDVFNKQLKAFRIEMEGWVAKEEQDIAKIKERCGRQLLAIKLREERKDDNN